MQRCKSGSIVPRGSRILIASEKLGNLNNFLCLLLLLLLLQFLLFTFHLISHVQCIGWVLISSYSRIRITFLFISSAKALSRVCLRLWSPRIFCGVSRLLVLILLVATTSIDRLILLVRLIAIASWLLLLLR